MPNTLVSRDPNPRSRGFGSRELGPLEVQRDVIVTENRSCPKTGGCWSWTVPTLVGRALAAKTQDGYWGYVRILHWRGSLEVFARATELCRHSDPNRRALGADILAQLGIPDRSYPAEALAELRALLASEKDPEVLESVLTAFAHAQESDDPTGVNKIASFADHPIEDVRYAVVWALLGHEDSISVAAMVKLSDDVDDDVRDWATFGLGSQIELDTPEIREALWARCDDDHDDTAGEALVGLARRKDQRAGAVLRRWLETDDPGSMIFEAATELGDPDVVPLLRHHLPEADELPHVDENWLRSLKDCIKDLTDMCKTERDP